MTVKVHVCKEGKPSPACRFSTQIIMNKGAEQSLGCVTSDKSPPMQILFKDDKASKSCQ